MAFRPMKPGFGQFITFRFAGLRIYNAELADKVRQEAELQVAPDDNSLIRLELVKLTPETQAAVLAALPFAAKVKIDDVRDNDRMNEIIMSDATREAKIKQDSDAGLARLTEWSTTGLLENTQSNAKAIEDWLLNNVKGYISVANIDAAISILGPKGENKLTWRKPAPPAPVAQEPVETLATLSDGTKQLKLGTTPNRSHTITQLRDLDQRERAARGRGGWHGAKF